jgi:hypothetical protein
VPLVGDRRVDLVLVFVRVFLIMQVPATYSAELSTSEPSFFSEVLKLDVTKYNVAQYFIESKSGYFADFGDLPKEEGDYVIKCNGSEIEWCT